MPTKKIVATQDLKHEDYKIEVTSVEEEFKILAQIEESNNVTISNFQIVEILNSEVDKNALVKKDNKTYTIGMPYNNTSKYVVIIKEGVCTDMYENNNEEAIKVI